ncbi:MAG: ATPase, T2SS/T4P/T4SS family [bacterium]
MLVKDENKFLDTLIELNLVTREQTELVKIESARSGNNYEDVLVDLKLLGEEDIVKAEAIAAGLAYVNLANFKLPIELQKDVSKEIATKYTAVPFGFTGEVLNVAMVDPNDVQALEFIEKKSGFHVQPYLASETGVSGVIGQYEDAADEVSEALQNYDTEAVPKTEAVDPEAGDLIQDAPVTRAVNTIIEYAARAKASDIHIEPREKTVKVRYRIDGILHETMDLPIHIHTALVSRIKILSNLKIDEHRIPQDGRFGTTVDKRPIDMRISISPTVFGEKVVIRLLDKSAGVITLDKLGVRGRAFKIIEAGALRPHGMVLSTGPTGSGKSTTLYALLTVMNKPDVNIITLEDPVEYQVDGVNQIQVNTAVGLTFESGLRSILRQDPDVIMVGEIRDVQTAGLAVQSALTGHTVLSTLHTNSAAGVLPRLLDMEIEPFLIASTVSTVIGQRLVRKICDDCKEQYEASPAVVDSIKKALEGLLPSHTGQTMSPEESGYKDLPFVEDDTFPLYRGKGCPTCNNSGYKGRVGIYEVFAVSDRLEKLIVGHATSSEIQEVAVKNGMVTMRQDGFLKALEGITTIEEVISKATED